MFSSLLKFRDDNVLCFRFGDSRTQAWPTLHILYLGTKSYHWSYHGSGSPSYSHRIYSETARAPIVCVRRTAQSYAVLYVHTLNLAQTDITALILDIRTRDIKQDNSNEHRGMIFAHRWENIATIVGTASISILKDKQLLTNICNLHQEYAASRGVSDHP